MKGLRIIIADNLDLTRTRLKFFLDELPGYHVVGEAKNTSEAVEQINRLLPDVLILDFETLGQNSLDVIQQIKAKALAPTIVLLATIPITKMETHRCLEAGADALLDKKTCYHELAPLLRRLIREPAILRPEMLRPWDFPTRPNQTKPKSIAPSQPENFDASTTNSSQRFISDSSFTCPQPEDTEQQQEYMRESTALTFSPEEIFHITAPNIGQISISEVSRKPS